MLRSKRGFRLGVCGAVLGAVYVGLASSAMAWNEPLWVRQFGTETGQEAFGVATDAAGNVYLTGYTITLGGPVDAWVAKYNAAGRVLWKRQLGTETHDCAEDVTTDPAGNVYLTGWTEGSLGGVHRGSTDAWVAKYDAAGRVSWKRQLGSETADFALAVATDAAGHVYLTGRTAGSLDGGANPNGTTSAWVAKYDAAGRKLWTRQLGTANWDFASTDASGNVYLTGYTYGALGGPNRGLQDAWLAKYGATGRVQWKRQLGTELEDRAEGVATDSAGNVYLTRWTTGSLGGATRGYADAWVAKYAGTGRMQWKRQLGTEDWDGASDVATDVAGNVYVTGTTFGSRGGVNRGLEDA